MHHDVTCCPGKFPHLLVKSQGVAAAQSQQGCAETVINFGTVFIGQSTEKWIEVCNLSSVSEKK